jgi:transposase
MTSAQERGAQLCRDSGMLVALALELIQESRELLDRSGEPGFPPSVHTLHSARRPQ